MDKYYTPELRDLYIGYQCEANLSASEFTDKEVWLPYEITILNTDQDKRFSVGDNSRSLRTKYLTREDIESLGWVWKRTYDRNGTYRGSYPTKMEFELGDVWKIGGGFLEFKPENQQIKITTVDEGFNADGPNHSIKYQGKCKSINELRKILEWVL